MKKEFLLDAKAEIIAKIAECESDNFLADIEKKVDEFRNALIKEHEETNLANLEEKKIELRLVEKLIAKAELQEIEEEKNVVEEIAEPIAEEQSEESIEQEQFNEPVAVEQPQIISPIPTASTSFTHQQVVNRPIFRP